MTATPTPEELQVTSLGSCSVDSPIGGNPEGGGRARLFVEEGTRILLDVEVGPGRTPPSITLERAGPRSKIFFEPSATTAAIVTCGGLAPGLNNVVRSAYYELRHNYGVPKVLGIRNGYRGLNPESGLTPIEMNEDLVHDINELGGTILGSSRGPQDPKVTVGFLESAGIDVLLCVGGDGTQRGALAIHEEARKRGVDVAVVGVPKTIDNDIPYVWLTFGFVSAVEKAQEVIRGAHAEARGAPNGISVVKLMGRDSGFIAAAASLASQAANFVLVPEVAFPLEGEQGFLSALERRVVGRGHAVVVVAEGAGQHLFEGREETRDASGNVEHEDIGPFLCDRIEAHFAQEKREVNLKYLDPSYLIRSIPANAWDRVLADRMARAAVHAGMAGKTGVMIGWCHEAPVHVPIAVATRERRHLELEGDLWQAVMASTRQPAW